jgi:hypothetical protein
MRYRAPAALAATFGDYVAAAASRGGLSDRDVAANVAETLGKTESAARHWWLRIRKGWRRSALSTAEIDALVDVLGVRIEDVMAAVRRAGL